MMRAYTFQPLAVHLLESTLFAALAALLTLPLKHDRARTRYLVWFAASLKFFIPFSLLLHCGARLAWIVPEWIIPGQIAGQLPLLFEQDLRLPLFPLGFSRVTSPAAVATPGVSTFVFSVLVALWFSGMVFVLISYVQRWRFVATALQDAVSLTAGPLVEMLQRLRKRTGIRSSPRIALSSSTWEPAVFGIFRSTIVLPAAVADHLDSAQLEAILTHELAHIRRCDNLLAALHMLVEAFFWFHPLVWYLGARLNHERELACDEEVLLLGGEPQTYAESILRICKLCLASPLACASGITGSDLKERIERIMSNGPRLESHLRCAKKLLLASAVLAAIFVPITIGLLSAPRAVAQTESVGNRPSFGAASIKPADPGARGIHVQFAPGGRFSASNVTLRFLIKIAYDLRDDQIGGGPAWLNSKRFDVDANSDPPIPGDPRNLSEQERMAFTLQVRLRLQSLLDDRFALKVRRDKKDMQVYNLVLSKKGPRLKAADGDSGTAQSAMRMGLGNFEASAITVDDFARAISEVTGRTVINQTGLDGRYAFKLQWAPDSGQSVPDLQQQPPPISGAPSPPSNRSFGDAPPPADPNAPPLTVAIQEQLGLKLVSAKGPADYFVIDSAQPLSEN